MTITASLTADQLRGVASAATSIARLPAVPTQAWCEVAGSAVQHLRPSAFVIVTIMTIADGSGPANVEATDGVASPASALHEDLSRIHADGLGSPGWNITELLRDQRCAALRLRDLAGAHATWPFAAAGKRWKRLGVNDLLVGAGVLHHEDRRRVLVVELGSGPDYPAFAQADAMVLDAVLEPLVHRAAEAFGRTPVSAAQRVTAREEQILQLLTLGDSVRDIAEKLTRSRHTVHDHVKSLHRKLGATRRGELIARYLGHAAPVVAQDTDDAGSGAPTPMVTRVVRPRAAGHAPLAS